MPVKRAIRRSLAAAGTALLLLMALELGLRFSRGPSAASPHPLLGVSDYRGPAFAAARDPRGVRLIVAGDEWAWGEGLAAEQAWPAQLEGLFARDGRASRIEILNGAQRGAGADDVLHRVRTRLLDCQPTWLVIALGVREALAAFTPASDNEWWMRSALVAWSLGELESPAPESVDRRNLQERIRRAQFDFGVRVAQIVEAAAAQRVYVALVQPPWPPLADGQIEAVAADPNALAGHEAALRLHTALCEELARVADQTGAALIDARASVADADEGFDAQGRLTARGARSMAEAVYDGLRPRIP